MGNVKNVIRSAENLSDPPVAAWCGRFGMKYGVGRPMKSGDAFYRQVGLSGAMSEATLEWFGNKKEERINERLSSVE